MAIFCPACDALREKVEDRQRVIDRFQRRCKELEQQVRALKDKRYAAEEAATARAAMLEAATEIQNGLRAKLDEAREHLRAVMPAAREGFLSNTLAFKHESAYRDAEQYLADVDARES